MWDYDIGMLPVTDPTGRVIGVLTDRDVAMAAYMQGKPLGDISVESAMSKEVFTARPTTSLAELERIMAHHQVRRVPVVDDSGRAIGMVALGDLALHSSSARGAWVEPTEVAATLRGVCRPRAMEPLTSE
jgi:CBS domain-containing protein